ncbi:hypothetical protein ACFWIZ_01305, partial [Streptomyces sp. NPDC127044]
MVRSSANARNLRPVVLLLALLLELAVLDASSLPAAVAVAFTATAAAGAALDVATGAVPPSWADPKAIAPPVSAMAISTAEPAS